jgi:hypothetical protein
MFNKEIIINNGFKEWLGENPTWGDICFIFGTAFLATGLLIAGFIDELRQLSLWQNILFVFISFDIIGGAVANFAVSTDRYYTQNKKKRWMFFAEHCIHFTLFYVAIGGNYWYWILIFSYTMISGAVVNLISETRVQEIVASAFVTIGCILFYSFNLLIPLMSWFPPVLMIKIIMGFAVQRKNLTII